MNDLSSTNSRIVAEYCARTEASKRLFDEAKDVFPSGIVHDSRKTDPYPIYVERAEGSRKWDVDGNEYIDFFGGHGSLLLGHAHPTLKAAVERQISRGTHPAACHELELRWGQLVKRLVPSAERVRFTASGTEANLMAIRLARAHTGRAKLMRLKDHFHGWQDHVAFGSHYQRGSDVVPGVIRGIVESVIVADPANPAAIREVLESDGDVAAVILEPTGASSGRVPLSAAFVSMLREITAVKGIVLIFDEVVTGFRVAPGGAQEMLAIKPDLTTLAKILAGGLPAGAVTGAKEIMDHLDFAATAEKGCPKIPHQGTFNANPLSAAAGVTMLEQVAETDVCRRAAEQGDKLRRVWNKVFADEGVDWAAYGLGSCVYLHTNPDGLEVDPLAFNASDHPVTFFDNAGGHPAVPLLLLALKVNGVDVSSKPGAMTSAVHSNRDIAETAVAMSRAITMLKAESML
ncbi:MAG: aminotransferase class III-fold pyridoxal phosphate-dependent enzyme [Pseudomonadota bacterium]|nr:aminotransferase class III-fold pyridoxal phosphate-dependent enzyme [Pseudomonadota bacterium]